MESKYKVNMFFDEEGTSFEKIVEVILKEFIQEKKKLHICNEN